MGQVIRPSRRKPRRRVPPRPWSLSPSSLQRRQGCLLTRFINTVLITVFAFFVFLGIFWQFAGGGTGAGARGDPMVTGIEPRWQPASPQELLVALTVHNPAGQEGRVSAITYEAKVDGVLVDQATSLVLPDPPTVIEAKSD